MGNIYQYTGIYLTFISLAAIVVTAYDKHAARAGGRRIKERTLLTISALGGSVAMLITMRAIRHKTKHIKFMAGIPLMIILQAAAVVLIFWRAEVGA